MFRKKNAEPTLSDLEQIEQAWLNDTSGQLSQKLQSKWLKYHERIGSLLNLKSKLASKKKRERCECSFCSKSKEDVELIVAGKDDTYICSECIDLCWEIRTEPQIHLGEDGYTVKNKGVEIKLSPNDAERLYHKLGFHLKKAKEKQEN